MTDEVIQMAELPIGWCNATLEQVAEINPSLPYHDIDDETEVSFLPMKVVEEESGEFDSSNTRQFGQVKKGYTPFVNDDVIFAKITPCMENGKAALVNNLTSGIGFGSTEFHVLRPERGLVGKFLFFYLIQKSFRHEAQSKMKGSAGQKRVPTTFIERAKIPLPPTPEQRRMVSKIEELLTKLDSGEAELRRATVQLRRYRQAVLKAAVNGDLTKEWRKTHHEELEPASELVARILTERREQWEINQVAKMKAEGKSHKNDDWKQKYVEPTRTNAGGSSQLPRGWANVSIHQVSECLDHRRVPINKKERNSRSGNVPYYGANGQVGWIDDFLFDEPLILVVEDETFTGREKPFCYKIAGKSWVNNHAHVLRATGAVNIDFLNYSLAYYPFTPLTTGTTGRKKLTRQALMSAPYQLPPFDEQQQIVSEVERALSIADAMEQTIEQSLKQAERMRQSILKKAFEGKLVPQNPKEEPAESLLERIRQERGKREAEKHTESKPGRRRFTRKQNKRIDGVAA